MINKNGHLNLLLKQKTKTLRILEPSTAENLCSLRDAVLGYLAMAF